MTIARQMLPGTAIQPVPLQPRGLLAPRLPEAAAFHLAIVLAPGFALMSFASVVEPARGANRVSGRKFYDWALFSTRGGEVESNSGITVRTRPLAELEADDIDFVVICAATNAEQIADLELESALRRLTRHGVAIGAVSTASFILARAGLLDGRRCTLHWDYLEAFREAFPEVEASEELYVIDDGVVTCAGATAALDMMLELIRGHHGPALARSIAEQFLHGAIRTSEDVQRGDLRQRLGVANPNLLKAVGLMEESVESPLPPGDLAAEIGVSQRQLERHFRRYLGCTPAKYYMRLRLDRARRLLRQTSLSVTEVAIASGFVALSHFAKAYRQQFGIRPRDDRGSR